VEAFDGAYDSVAVHWQVGPARSWNLLRPGDAEFLLRDGLQVHVAVFDRFNQKRVGWGDPLPWLEVRFGAAWVDVYWALNSIIPSAGRQIFRCSSPLWRANVCC
jgi:hypothetical protein